MAGAQQPGLAQHALLPHAQCPWHCEVLGSWPRSPLFTLLCVLKESCDVYLGTAVPESLVSEPSHEPSDQPHPAHAVRDL